MAHASDKDGFINISEIRRFIYGENNSKHCKVYVRIEEIDGYYYLCIWKDCCFTPTEVTPATDLSEVNGFRKMFQLKLNKIQK